MNERELQSAVIETARFFGWRVAHFRPALTAKGWRTPVEADGQGFPDLVMARGQRLVFAELKSETGKLGPGQAEWLLAVAPCAETFIWRPSDWTSGVIEEVLRG